MSTLLETRGLHKAFGGQAAVDGVDLSVGEGTIHAVIGPNGAGKTTLFNLITGHLRADDGSARLGGAVIGGLAPFRIARMGLARVFQTSSIFRELTVEDSIVFGIAARERTTMRLRTRSTRSEALEIARLVGIEGSLERTASTLSHGDQRAVEIALALGLRPRMLLLDEPTAGMSAWEARWITDLMRDLTRSRGLTILFCEHNMDVVFGVAGTVTVMHKGSVLVEGTPDVVRENAQAQSVYLGEASW